MASSESDHDDGNKKCNVLSLEALLKRILPMHYLTLTNGAQRSLRAVSTRVNSNTLKVIFSLITINTI